MSARAKALSRKIEKLMEEASVALVETRYIDCERSAHQALRTAHEAHDFEAMSRIVLPLLEARRQRRQIATAVKKVVRIDSYADLEPLLTGGKSIKPGCYLVEPPLVGADGRELRERSLAEGVAVFVLVREPETRLKQWPLVSVWPTTVRARVSPPKKVDVAWMELAGEALGDAALALVDPQESCFDRVDHMMDLLETVVDHEKLHQTLAAACVESAHELATNPKKAKLRVRPPSEIEAEFSEEGDES